MAGYLHKKGGNQFSLRKCKSLNHPHQTEPKAQKSDPQMISDSSLLDMLCEMCELQFEWIPSYAMMS